ncbi:MAG: hypothetical protein IT548_10340 [Alphaproteobacteria bacterium]|nr:hypothetical protein [Alphaproteobacteria bacterium]
MSGDDTDPPPAIRRHRSKWRETVLICRKCTKKAKGGFGRGGRLSLRKALRRKLRLGKGRAALIGLVEVDCFKLCPKRAVTVARGSDPGSLYAIPRRAPLGEIVDTLELRRDGLAVTTTVTSS